MTEKDFSNVYEYIKNTHKDSKESLMLHISMLRMYLLATGKEDIYQTNYPIKLHIRTLLELVLSLSQLFRSLLSRLWGKPAEALILIIEPTHLKQMQGMETYLSRYNPIFLTTKRNYISVIKTTFNTNRIIYIPSFFINPKWVKTETLANLYKTHHINISGELINYSCQVANDQINHFRYIKFLLRTLSKVNPIKIVFVFNDLTATGRIISLLLQEKPCKTCYVMHGLLSDEFIESIHIADEFFIFGEYTRSILVKRGISDQHIHTIGTPYLDYYRNYTPLSRLKNEVLNKHSQNKSIALILLSGRGHTTSSKHHDALIKLLNEIIEANKDQYYFIFKLHKKDYSSFYQLLDDNTNIKNCFALYTFDHFESKESIFDWLAISDLIITGASTTALEAMYLQKPVITVDLMGEYENETQYISQQGTYHCRNQQEFQAALTLLKSNQFLPKPQAHVIADNYFSESSKMHKFFFTEFDSLVSR